ncbi:hypothetical protein [Streptomyces sp. HSG2]|uniref:hypothetical protein n=1 Tax=Streptomyces sp. HSG2 TaxID=2797167 RepID=UPI0019049100|nr:hypothetical protein [Streptomyces sp. HSG2]
MISAVRDLNRLELAGESVRAVLEALAGAAPSWLAGRFGAERVAEWELRYAARVDSWRLPSSKTRRDRLAEVYGQDALVLLRAVREPDAPAWLREVEPVELLRRIFVQTYHVTCNARGREVVRKREADSDGVPPGQLRLASPYDADARWSAKGDELFWCGYKVHLTETCDNDNGTDGAGGTDGTAPAAAGRPAPDHGRGHHRLDRAGRDCHRRHPAPPGRTPGQAGRALPRLRLPLRRPRHRRGPRRHHHDHPAPRRPLPPGTGGRGLRQGRVPDRLEHPPGDLPRGQHQHRLVSRATARPRRHRDRLRRR